MKAYTGFLFLVLFLCITFIVYNRADAQEVPVNECAPAPVAGECVDTGTINDGWGWNGVAGCELPIVEVEREEIVEEPVTIVEQVVEVVTPVVQTIKKELTITKVEKDDGDGPRKKRNKHEWYEKECLQSRDLADWDYSRRSVNEIKKRCAEEVAQCPVRSLL